MNFFTWIFASCILCTSVDQRNIFLQLVRKILKPLLLIQFIPRHRSSDIPAVDSLDNFHYTQHSPFTKLHLHYAVYTFFLSSNMTGVYGRKYVRDRDNPIICSLRVHVTFSGLRCCSSCRRWVWPLSLILITSSQVSGIKMTPSLSTIWKQ